MKEDQEQKCHVCRFCKQGFSNGKTLGGHMRRHLALIATCRTEGFQENNQEAINGGKGAHVHNNGDDTGDRKQSIQETINGEKCLDFDDVMVKKSQQEHDSGANVYVLRENPKKSWRVSCSSKDYDRSRTESMKSTVCEKCGKVFDSVRALYGHMRCHSIKRSRSSVDESSLLSSSEERGDDGVGNAVRNKRSCTKYKSGMHNDEVEKGALCLMMLSRGVRDLDAVEFAVSMGYCKLKNKSKLGQKKDLFVESGSGQMNSGLSRSTPVKHKSNKKRANDVLI